MCSLFNAAQSFPPYCLMPNRLLKQVTAIGIFADTITQAANGSGRFASSPGQLMSLSARYAHHGFCRRLDELSRAIEFVFDILPPTFSEIRSWPKAAFVARTDLVAIEGIADATPGYGRG
jgi:hypothetical protein